MLILKQYSWFYSHLGHCSLGGTLRCLIWHLLQVFVYHLLSINCIHFLLQTSHHGRFCLLLSGVRQVGEGDGLAVGEPHHLPPLQQFHISSITVVELSSLTSLESWGEKQKIHYDIAFLLILAEEEATGDRKYGLLTIWVNPCQTRVCSMQEVARELTAWVSSGPNWPYAFVWLHKDTCFAPWPMA